jgi:hypothetical protein
LPTPCGEETAIGIGEHEVIVGQPPYPERQAMLD